MDAPDEVTTEDFAEAHAEVNDVVPVETAAEESSDAIVVSNNVALQTDNVEGHDEHIADHDADVDLLTADVLTLTQRGLSIDTLLTALNTTLDDLPASSLPQVVSPPATTQQKRFMTVTEDGKVQLSELWRVWQAVLNEQQHTVLFSYYGLDGDEPLTLQEIGDEVGLT